MLWIEIVLKVIEEERWRIFNGVIVRLTLVIFWCIRMIGVCVERR